MHYVVTEICDKTGSWLEDFVVQDLPGSIRLKQPIITDIDAPEYKGFLSQFPIKTKKVTIRLKSVIEEAVSYKIHTNRELHMMLLGIKPFSVFSKLRHEDYDIYNGQRFEDYKKKIFSEYFIIDEVEYFFKFLPGEEWRTSAFSTLVRVRLALGNCAQLEMIEGFLLGYSERQNFEFIQKFYSKRTS